MSCTAQIIICLSSSPRDTVQKNATILYCFKWSRKVCSFRTPYSNNFKTEFCGSNNFKTEFCGISEKRGGDKVHDQRQSAGEVHDQSHSPFFILTVTWWSPAIEREASDVHGHAHIWWPTLSLWWQLCPSCGVIYKANECPLVEA